MKVITGTWLYEDGTPIAGGRLFLELSQDAVALGTAQVAPQLISFTLDSNGSLPANTKCYFNDELAPSGTTYMVAVVAPGGGVVWGSESISVAGSSFNFNNAQPTTQNVMLANVVFTNPTAAQTITGFDLNITGANLNVTGNASVSGRVTGGSFTGGSLSTPNSFGNTTISSFTAAAALIVNGLASLQATTIKSLNGLAVVFADQYADVQTAINALPTAGGTVDARSPNVNLALGTIDPGTKSVTLLLGPLSYTADHIVLQANFRIIGTASVPSGTTITSVGANSQALIVNNTSGLINVRFPEIENVTFVGLSGNTTQNGLFVDLSANTVLSVIDHFTMRNVNFSAFKGKSIYVKGPSTNNGNFNQFWKFDHVTAVRPSSAAEALRITGASGQLDFYSCQFDGAAQGDGTNIYIGTEANGDTVIPYSINFYSVTSQGANIAFNGSGFNQVGFYNSHHENLNIAYQLDALHTNSKNSNASFIAGYFANVGSNAGAGRFLNVTTTLAYNTVLAYCDTITLPDKFVSSTSGAEVRIIDNGIGQNLSSPMSTTGVDASLAPAATMNIGSYHTIVLSASGTSITTLNSQLAPGELITFYANGTCQFATGGNITLPGYLSPMLLRSGETATFENSDFTGTNTWRLVAVTSLGQKAVIDLTGQTAAKTATLLFAVPADGQGRYKVSWSADITTVGSVSSTLGGTNGFQVQFTSPTDSVVKTTNPTITTGMTSAANTTATSVGGSLLVFAKASTNINYLFDYTSAAANTMTYELHIVIEFLG